MVKFKYRKLRIIYPLFIFLLGFYVGQQLHLALQSGMACGNISIKPHLEKRLFPHSKTTTQRKCRHSQTSSLDSDTVFVKETASTLHTPIQDSNTIRRKMMLTPSNKSQKDFNSKRNVSLKTLVRLNDDQNIRNVEKFPLKLGNESVVILVQVHNRVEDLKILVDSLQKVRFINESLVVFSHDLYSKPLFDVIQSIDFCPVLQLFYPYSIQFYDKSFPGDSPGDCPKNLTRTFVEEYGTKCFNADFYDSFGHYRQGHMTQMKHHWLWKQHFVFDRVRVLRNYQGIVLRLDNDYYLAEDTIHVIRALNKVQNESCPECLMYIMGDRENNFYGPHTFKSKTGIIEVFRYSANVGRGMAYRAEFWRKFKTCARTFCHFDDYNWDWSLQRTSVDCLKELYVLKPAVGRVFHIGACHGFHRNDEMCNSKIILSRVVSCLDQIKSYLYPKTLKLKKHDVLVTKRRKGYGSWSDPRDQLLCMKIFHNETDKPNFLSDINKVIQM